MPLGHRLAPDGSHRLAFRGVGLLFVPDALELPLKIPGRRGVVPLQKPLEDRDHVFGLGSRSLFSKRVPVTSHDRCPFNLINLPPCRGYTPCPFSTEFTHDSRTYRRLVPLHKPFIVLPILPKGYARGARCPNSVIPEPRSKSFPAVFFISVSRFQINTPSII